MEKDASKAEQTKTGHKKVGVNKSHVAESEEVPRQVASEAPASTSAMAKNPSDEVIDQTGSNMDHSLHKKIGPYKVFNPELTPNEIDRIGSLQLQIQRLKATIDVIERRFSSAKRLNKDQYRQLQEQLDVLGKQISLTQSISTNTQERISSLVPNHKAQQKEQSQQFVALNHAHQQVVKRIEKQLQLWSKEIEEQIGAVHCALERSDEQSEQIEKLNTCMQGLQSGLVEALSDINAQLDSVKKMQTRIQDEAGKQNHDFENMRRALNNEVGQARVIHRELTSMLDSFCTKQKTAFGDYETLRRALKADRTNLSLERKNVDKLRDELAHLQAMTIEAHRVASEHQVASKSQLDQIEKIAANYMGGQARQSEQAPQEVVGSQVAVQQALESSVRHELEQLDALNNKISQAQSQLEKLTTTQQEQGDHIQSLSEQTQVLETQLGEGLNRLSNTVDQQLAVEQRLKGYAQQIEQALEQADSRFAQFDGISKQCDQTVEQMRDLKGQWAHTQSANDEQYKNLSALLTRSRDNEKELERLLAQVTSLESRSEYLLETAQTQRQKQHEFAQRIQTDQEEAAVLRENAKKILSTAERAASQAASTGQNADNVLKVVQGIQAELLLEHDTVLEKAAAAQERIHNAFVEAKAIHDETLLMAQRQKALEKQCVHLLDESGEHVGGMTTLRQETGLLHEQMQTRLDQVRGLEQSAQSALERADQLFGTVKKEQERLEVFHENAVNALAQSLDENKGLVEQAQSMQVNIDKQVQQQERAQQALLAMQGKISGQESRVNASLEVASAMNADWEKHQKRMSELEQRAEDSQASNQDLFNAAEALLSSAADEQHQLQALMTEVKTMAQSVAESLEKGQALRGDTERMQAELGEQARKQSAVAVDQASALLRTEVMHDQITEMDKKHQANAKALEDLHRRASTLLSENIDLQTDVRVGHSQLADLVERVDENLDRTGKIHELTTQQLEACQSRCQQMDEALPRLNHELERYGQLGTDYSQWEAKLKNQAMSLKDTEGKLREQVHALESGMTEVGKVREEMKKLEQEFGNVKKVLAQLIQKFKGVEQGGALLETRCDKLENGQDEQDKHIQRLQTQLEAVDQRIPDEAQLQEALEEIRLQRQFNDSVVDKIDTLAKRYVNMQEQLHVLHSLPNTVSGLDSRLQALESAVGHSADDAQTKQSIAAMDARLHGHGAALGGVESEIQALRQDLSDLAKTMVPNRVPNNAPSSEPAATDHMHTESRRPFHSAPVADQLSPSELPVNQAVAPAMAESPPVLTREKKPESELHRLSEQLERLSREAQSWDEPELGKEKRQGKQFLFSLLALVSILISGFWPQKHLETAPTFAYEHFSLDLIHPDQRFDGPKLSAEAVALIRQDQSLHTYNMRQVQWPVPAQGLQSKVQPSSINHAVYITSHRFGPVTAIDDGRVIFSGLSEGDFGKVVIVAHEGALVSVYGYLHDTWVDSGAEVLQGQVIARLPSSLEPKLYFELRVEGESVPTEQIFAGSMRSHAV